MPSVAPDYLASLQTNVGLDLISNALSGNGSESSINGWGVLASLAPIAIFKLVGNGAIKSTMSSRGKVAYPSKKPPLDHEISTAEHLAHQLGVGVYLRGGNSAAGADAFVSGLRWEFKRILENTPNSVKSNLEKSVTQFRKHHSGVSPRIVLDGRGSGLTEETFQAGIRKLQSSQRKEIAEIMYILKNGEIIKWP